MGFLERPVSRNARLRRSLQTPPLLVPGTRVAVTARPGYLSNVDEVTEMLGLLEIEERSDQFAGRDA